MTELSDKVAEWFQKSGFPLEMRVANSLAKAGLSVTRSDYYLDGDSGQHREIDVVAGKTSGVEGHNATVRAHLVIECKTSSDKPWIVMSVGKRIGAKAMTVQSASSTAGDTLLRVFAAVSERLKPPLFSPPERIGYGIVQAFSKKGNGNDMTYEACMAASKAAQFSTQRWEKQSGPPGQIVASIAFPVIVTDAPIFVAALPKTGDLKFEEVEHALLAWRNPVVGSPHTIIHIVNEKGLEKFAREASSCLSSLVDGASEYTKGVLAHPVDWVEWAEG